MPQDESKQTKELKGEPTDPRQYVDARTVDELSRLDTVLYLYQQYKKTEAPEGLPIALMKKSAEHRKEIFKAWGKLRRVVSGKSRERVVSVLALQQAPKDWSTGLNGRVRKLSETLSSRRKSSMSVTENLSHSNKTLGDRKRLLSKEGGEQKKLPKIDENVKSPEQGGAFEGIVVTVTSGENAVTRFDLSTPVEELSEAQK